MATTAPTDIGADHRAVINTARATLTPSALGDLCFAMTSIPSPTGEELALADLLGKRLSGSGATVRVSRFGASGASLVARVGRGTDGPRLWLYAPLDTAFSGSRSEDSPWLGYSPRADFALPPTRAEGKVIGLGAENPKGFAAAAVAAFEAVATSGADLRGEVVLTLCGGSMPVSARPGLGSDVGHGAGVKQLLAEERRPDFVILLKPGYAVSHEEVGYAWFRVTLRGAVNYTGIRHKGPYRNPVLAAARVVQHLEGWFAEFTAANSAGFVAPQGSINAIRAGSSDRASFVPATAELDLDLRVAPDSNPDDVQAQLEKALERLRDTEPDLDYELTRTVALPGTRTDPESWIVRSLVRAWEELEGTPHEPIGRSSGASDAAILRSNGIPTARIGLPPPATPSPFSGFSMGVADDVSMARLATLLVQPLVETAARTRAEVGLE
jgi:acetylornithine deacetylase/succinyl-diaminopimelate desuccinylase-like protein